MAYINPYMTPMNPTPVPTPAFGPNTPVSSLQGGGVGLAGGGAIRQSTTTPVKQTSPVVTGRTPAPSNNAPSGPTDAQYDALGVARGDIGGYERVLREQQQQTQNAENQVRNDITAGYDAYLSTLDQMMGNIPGEQQGQEQIVNNNYNQGLSDIQALETSSMGDLATSRRKTNEQQVTSLRDIADNIRNLFQTGNVMLGTRGAGDSSAANQYSYAVTKLGSKQRGDVLAQTRSIENDIADREAKVKNIVLQETSKLKTERDNNILQVAQFFKDKQNEILQAKANGLLQKGQSLAQLSMDLLNQAKAQIMQQDQNYQNRQNALLSWAANNAQTIGQLKANLASISQVNVPQISASQMSGMPSFDAQGNMTTPLYGGGVGTTEKDKNLSNLGGMLYK